MAHQSRFLSLLMLIGFVFSLASCASYMKRKECEKINWFEYGEKVALSGKRLEGDTNLQECRKAETDIDEAALDRGFKKGMNAYCIPEGAFQTGKKGDFFSEELCGGMNVKELKVQHTKGVRSYCTPANGLPQGATGKKYNNICPDDLEVAFLKEFNKGRKNYLGVMISKSNDRIHQIDREIDDLDRRKRGLYLQLTSMRGSTLITREKVYDPATRSYREKVNVSDDQNVENQRRNLQWDIDGIDRQITAKRDEQRQARQEISEMSAEVAGLN